MCKLMHTHKHWNWSRCWCHSCRIGSHWLTLKPGIVNVVVVFVGAMCLNVAHDGRKLETHSSRLHRVIAINSRTVCGWSYAGYSYAHVYVYMSVCKYTLVTCMCVCIYVGRRLLSIIVFAQVNDDATVEHGI